jgi:hypothetical protein
MNDVDEFVILECECGSNFQRKKSLVDKHEEYKVESPSVARFYKRKITYCDKCLHERMKASFKSLPDILKALAT